jgi:hypothetical protein
MGEGIGVMELMTRFKKGTDWSEAKGVRQEIGQCWRTVSGTHMMTIGLLLGLERVLSTLLRD